MTPGRPPTDRTRVRRLPEKQVESAEVRDAILAAGIVGHLAATDDHGQPFVLPVAYAPWRDMVIFHGSTGSRLFRSLANPAKLSWVRNLPLAGVYSRARRS